MRDKATAQDIALAEALLWLKNESQDTDLVEVMFGTRSDGSGCWWTMRFSHEVTSGEVRASAQDDEKRHFLVIAAWRKAYLGEEQEAACHG